MTPLDVAKYLRAFQKAASTRKVKSRMIRRESRFDDNVAELMRQQRGGTAVVLGALSPRVRNAQVGMYQAGEVDYLVATDAIGMGLNLDIDHVAFAGLSKFDGIRQRRLTPAEMAQIAFLPTKNSEVELVRPTSSDSGLGRYLEKRGPGMHHLCLEVDDIDGMMAQLKSQGIRLINEEPRVAADGKKYAFIHPEGTGGVLVELYQL